MIVKSNIAVCAGLLQEMLKAARTGKASAEWKVICVVELFMACKYGGRRHSSGFNYESKKVGQVCKLFLSF